MLDLNNPRVFETALDSLGVGVYLVDRHRKIVYWNRGAERISGYLRHRQILPGRHPGAFGRKSPDFRDRAIHSERRRSVA